jgi:phosphoribosyl 1,2-cyclic phosphate phosphodiesterase
MKIEILGSGGAFTTPKIGCRCRVCTEARSKGVLYSRTGPSVFVHGPELLIDTPEESKLQLNRAGIEHVPFGTYSHWHPDHVMGRRVWETNGDPRNWPRRNRCSDVYVPAGVARDFRRTLGTWDHLRYLEENGVVRLIELAEGQGITLQGTRVHPFPLAQAGVYGFLLEEDGRRLVIVLDDALDWRPSPDVQGADLAVIPMGIKEFDPFTGERCISEEHPVLRWKASFQHMLGIVRKLGASRVVMAHIEEADGLTYDDLLILSGRLQDEGLPITFAHDAMVIDV